MTASCDVERPRIEFPCQYPIKVIGDARDDLSGVVVSVVRQHVRDFDETTIEIKDSRQGRFLSVRFVIRAEGEEHIRALFSDLKALPGIHMIL